MGEQTDLAERLRHAEAEAAAKRIDISTHLGAIERRCRAIEARLYDRPLLDPD